MCLVTLNCSLETHHFCIGKQYKTKTTETVSVTDTGTYHYERRNIGACFLKKKKIVIGRD